MTESETACDKIGPALFCCRPRALQEYFRLRYQGALPLPKRIESFIGLASPILESVILAGLPLVILGVLITVVMGLKPRADSWWVRLINCGVLAVGISVAWRWFWISPRRDRIIISEGRFRWRISLARLEWFRCEGEVAFADLQGFLYRSDWLEPTAVEPGPSPNENLYRLWLELNLGRHDLLLYLKDNRTVALRNVFARFEQDDLERLLHIVSRAAEPLRVPVWGRGK
jgi:hypothetical protein